MQSLVQRAVSAQTVGAGKEATSGHQPTSEELTLKSMQHIEEPLEIFQASRRQKRLDRKEPSEHDIAEALVKYNDCHPRSEMLPVDQQVHVCYQSC